MQPSSVRRGHREWQRKTEVKCPNGMWGFAGKTPPSPFARTLNYHFVVVQLLSRVHDPVDCRTPGSPSFTFSQSLLKLLSIEWMMPSNQLVLRQL